MRLTDVLNKKTMDEYSDKVVEAVLKDLKELIPHIRFKIRFNHDLDIDYKNDDIIITLSVEIDYPVLDYNKDYTKTHYSDRNTTKRIDNFIKRRGYRCSFPASCGTVVIKGIGYSIKQDKIIDLRGISTISREIEFWQSRKSRFDYKD